MEQAQSAVGSTQRADLVELSVVLVATSNNPSIVNPDFLAHNGIVDRSRPIQGDPISTPVFAQVAYEGGLTVRADPERIVFAQSALGASLTDTDCPAMAASYAQAVPHVPYRAVGINPKLYIARDDASAKVANLLHDRGAWLSFKDSEPEIQLKAIFPLSSRKIIVDVLGASIRHPDGRQTSGLVFQANVHRDLEQTSLPKRIDALNSILHQWENDVLDCRELADKFAPSAFDDLA